jgi:hypothetical protein
MYKLKMMPLFYVSIILMFTTEHQTKTEYFTTKKEKKYVDVHIRSPYKFHMSNCNDALLSSNQNFLTCLKVVKPKIYHYTKFQDPEPVLAMFPPHKVAQPPYLQCLCHTVRKTKILHTLVACCSCQAFQYVYTNGQNEETNLALFTFQYNKDSNFSYKKCIPAVHYLLR